MDYVNSDWFKLWEKLAQKEYLGQNYNRPLYSNIIIEIPHEN